MSEHTALYERLKNRSVDWLRTNGGSLDAMRITDVLEGQAQLADKSPSDDIDRGLWRWYLAPDTDVEGLILDVQQTAQRPVITPVIVTPTETPSALATLDSVQPTALAKFARAANRFAANSVFADFQERKSANTLRAHRADLETFSRFVCSADPNCVMSAEALMSTPDAWRDMEWGVIDTFKRWLLNESYSVGTINRILSTVKVYAKLAFKAGVLTVEQYAQIRTVEGYAAGDGEKMDEKRSAAGDATRRQVTNMKKAQHNSLTDAQAKALKHNHPDTPQGRRDALLMTILIDLGLRCGEVALLTVGQLDLKERRMHNVRRPKTRLVQELQISKDLRAMIQRCEKAGELLPVGALVRGCTRPYKTKPGVLLSTGLSERAINQRVQALGQQIGIDNLSPHDCRHYFATRAVKGCGGDLFAVQEAGGWKGLEMVRRYADRATVANATLLDLLEGSGD